MSGEAMVHLEVVFHGFADLPLHFQALEPVARAFAAAAAARSIARVRIDDVLTETLKPLPYSTLWP